MWRRSLVSGPGEVCKSDDDDSNGASNQGFALISRRMLTLAKHWKCHLFFFAASHFKRNPVMKGVQDWSK